MWIFWLIVALLVLAMIYVRTAPVDIAKMSHVPAADGLKEQQTSNSFLYVVDLSDEQFESLLEHINATPRTKLVAGELASDHMVFETRSFLWGFPDYTTVDVLQRSGPGHDLTTVRLYGKARFGKSDFGVNRARITEWLFDT